jgi:enoyl-CoA hydratase/carnithine racemase
MNEISDPSPGLLHLIVMQRTGIRLMIDMAARLALRGPVRVLDGGNCFNAYICSRSIARALWASGGGTARLPEILGRIRVARAFTAYQALALLAQTPASPHPTLALDLLATFYDENVPVEEALQMVEQCAGRLRRLSRGAPVAVSAAPPPAAAAGREALLETLEACADRVWIIETPAPPSPPQLNLL